MLSSCRSMHSSAPIELLLCLWRHKFLSFISPMWGKKSPSRELLSSILGIIECLWGTIESLLRIAKPTDGINKPYMGDNVLSYKALPLLGRNICHCPNVCESCGQFIRTNLLDSYYLKIFLAKLALISELVVLFIISWPFHKKQHQPLYVLL